MARRSLPNRAIVHKLPPVSCGHSKIIDSIPLTDSQLEELKKTGKTVVVIETDKGITVKEVRPSNVKNGKVYYYLRSTGEIALRNFASDRERHARHYAAPGKPFSGDVVKRRRKRR